MGRKERREYERQLRKKEGLSKSEAAAKVLEMMNPNLDGLPVMIDYEAYIRSDYYKNISKEMQEYLTNNRWEIYTAKAAEEKFTYKLEGPEEVDLIMLGRYLRPLAQPKATVKMEDGEEKTFEVDTDSRNLNDIVSKAVEQAEEEVEFVEAEVVGIED